MRLKTFTLLLLLVFVGKQAKTQSTVEGLQDTLKIVKTDSARGEVLRQISKKYYARDNVKSKEYAEKSYNYFTKAGNKNGQGLALQMLGYVLVFSGKNTEALEAQKESIRLLEESGNYAAAVISYSGASYCLEKEGRINEALKLVIRSLEIIDEHKLPDAQKAKNLVDLGRVYRQNNQHQKAIETYNKALSISVKEKDHSTSGVLYMNIGNVYSNIGDYKKALEFHSKSLKEMDLCNCAGRKTTAWCNIGYANFQLGNAEAVAQAANNAEQELIDKDNLNAVTDIETLKGSAAQLKGHHDTAIKHFEFAIEMARANGFKEKVIMISTLLGKSYAATGNSGKLENLLSSSLATKDSSYNQEMAKSIAEMEIKYETDIKERELAEAAAQNALKEQYISDIKLRNNWLIALFIVGLLLAGTSFWLLLRSRKAGKQLVEKNSELATLLEQKKILLKEIHHRVKNNLQTVSSLLNLQTRSSDSPVVKKAMVEGQTRLKSISLLHQKLYQHDELTKIEMDDYINDLAQYIIKNFNLLNKHIALKTNANAIALDLDTAIPLGLILNELVTNTIKHSFKDIDVGEIDVSIQRLDGDKNFELKVRNNGQGLPSDIDIDTLPSMGLKLVKSLSRQIHGSFNTFVDDRANFVVQFTETIQ
jgi:two-component system, sensor histidine kinase PdtaS